MRNGPLLAVAAGAKKCPGAKAPATERPNDREKQKRWWVITMALSGLILPPGHAALPPFLRPDLRRGTFRFLAFAFVGVLTSACPSASAAALHSWFAITGGSSFSVDREPGTEAKRK